MIQSDPATSEQNKKPNKTVVDNYSATRHAQKV